MTNHTNQARERVAAVARGGTINETYKKFPIEALAAFRADLLILIEATRLAVGDEPTCDTCGAKQSDENEYCSDVFHAPWARSGDEPTEAMVEAGADIAAMEVGDQWTGRGEYCRLATAIWKAMRNAETKGEG